MRRGEGGRGDATRRYIFVLFPCPADHERDWSACKVDFSGWQQIRRLWNITNTKKKHNTLLTIWRVFGGISKFTCIGDNQVFVFLRFEAVSLIHKKWFLYDAF